MQQKEMVSREIDLSRLREQAMFQEQMEAQARKLKDKYDAERAGGVYLSWTSVGGLAFVGLGASMARLRVGVRVRVGVGVRFRF